MKERKRIYVGVQPGGGRERFNSASVPTQETHGRLYAAVIGPFRTARGAEFMRLYGRGNPHVQCVADAGRLERKEQRHG
jgi:hypothetical protein